MKSIKEIRREKLAVAIEDRCEGNQSRAADALGYSSPSLVNRYLSGAKDIGDRTARKVEETFGYPRFWMDSEAKPAMTQAETDGMAARARFLLQHLNAPAAALAETIKAPASDIEEWTLGLRRPTLAQAAAIQDRYQVNSVWLMTGKGQPSPQIRYNDEWNPIPIPRESYRRIPVVAMAQLGDNGLFCDLEYPVGHGDGYLHFISTDPDAYGLRCAGQSMEPRIREGEFVVVAPNHPVQNGDEVLVKSRDGRVMVKVLGYTRDGYATLLSVNEMHKPIKIATTEIETMSFIEAIVKASAWRPE